MSSDMFKLSKEQEQAVDISKNIAVSAGAGSGKTRVLTNRYLRLLEAGNDIEDIGAITFTEKAALEMKKRIRLAINEKINVSIENDKTKWINHLDKLNNANVSTIHSFCSNIIKDNAAILGIDFDFNIISDTDRELIINDAVQKSLNKAWKCIEYKDSLCNLMNKFGDKYLSQKFNKEIKDAMSQMLRNGKTLEEIDEKYEKGSAENLIIKIAKETSESYAEYKVKHDLLDYDDLQSLTLKLLEDKYIRDRYRNRYKTLLVDEFQDVDELEKRIIYKIAADDEGKIIDKKLFIVGDFKQSIYGFKGADYTIFEDVASDIGDDGKVLLNTCYRSKNEIICVINSIFKELIDDYELLKQSDNAEFNEKRVSIITYEKSQNKELLNKVKNMLQDNNCSDETLNVAFKDLTERNNSIKNKDNDSGMAVIKAIKLLKSKGLNFRDICILVRSRNYITEIENELRKRKVPYCIIGGKGFYESNEVEDILNLYKVIVRGIDGEFNIQEDRNFINALRSPLIQISDKVILKMKIEKDESKCINLYKALEIVFDGMEECKEKSKLEKVFNSLKKICILKQKLSVICIIKAMIKEFNIYNLVLTQSNSEQRFRNVEKLIREAQKFDDEQLFILEQFVEYIELLEENSFDDAEASLDTEDSEAVKIMTIHQSKGLEFRGVIIPNIEKDLLAISTKFKPKVVYDEENLIFAKELDSEKDKESKVYADYHNNKLQKEVHECIRLLYVAMTRAMEYLVLTGADDGKVPAEEESDIKKFNSFIKQIKYALNVKNADYSLIEFLEANSLENLKTINTEKAVNQIDKLSIKNKLNFQLDLKPSAMVSATKYMHYKESPEMFYLKDILNINLEDYLDIKSIENGKIIYKEKNSYEVESGINAANLGTIVHHILEVMNSDDSIDKEIIIQDVICKYNLSSKDGIENRIGNLINNYEVIENSKGNIGELLVRYNELEYNLQPMEDRKTSFTGFIDRLELFKGESGITAVITDYKTNRINGQERIDELTKVYEPQLYLYGKAVKELFHYNELKIDNILLQLYFLDSGQRVKIEYDYARVNEYLEDMDKIFSANLSKANIKKFI